MDIPLSELKKLHILNCISEYGWNQLKNLWGVTLRVGSQLWHSARKRFNPFFMCYHTLFKNHICNFFCWGNREICVYYTGWISSKKLHLLLAEILPPNTKKNIFHSYVTMCLSKTIVALFFCWGNTTVSCLIY